MSAMPPSDPRAIWRAQRAQQQAAQRAQRAAWKAQQRAARYYWHSRRRPSMIGPIVLILIGVVALLLMTGRLDPGFFWSWYGQWWPLLLIGVGTAMVAEWFWDRHSGHPAVRTGGYLFLVVLLAITGWASHGVSTWQGWHTLNDEFGSGNWDFSPFRGEEHTNDQHSELQVPANAQVQIQDPRGNINVTGGEANRLTVEGHQVAYGNEEKASKEFASLNPKVTVSGNTVLIRVEGTQTGRADLTLSLPPDASIEINSGRGDVVVSGLRGTVNVNSGRGDVKLNDLGSTARARMSKGDFSAHAIRGDVFLQGHLGNATLSDIAGKALLEGEYFGDTHVERVSSGFHFRSTRTEIQLARLDGDLTLDSDDLTIHSAAGPVSVSSRSKNVEMTQIYGTVYVQDSNGSVEISSASPLGDIQVNNRHGDVTVSVPPNAGFTIAGEARGGDISSDFPLTINGGDTGHTISGQVGKPSARIQINIDHGDLKIGKGEAYAPLPPTPPVPPARGDLKAPQPPQPPAAPGRSPRRLKTTNGSVSAPASQ